MRDDECDSDSDMYSYEFCTLRNSEQFTAHFKPDKIEILMTKVRRLQEQNIRSLLLLSCFHTLTGKHQREPITPDLDLGV